MKLPPLSEAELIDFLAGKWIAKLATIGKDGTPRITSFWYEYRKDYVALDTYEHSETVRNLRSNHIASLLIDSHETPYRGVHFYGIAEVADRLSSTDEIAQIWTRYTSPHDAMGRAQTVTRRGPRVGIRFVPARKVTYDYGKPIP